MDYKKLFEIHYNEEKRKLLGNDSQKQKEKTEALKKEYEDVLSYWNEIKDTITNFDTTPENIKLFLVKKPAVPQKHKFKAGEKKIFEDAMTSFRSSLIYKLCYKQPVLIGSGQISYKLSNTNLPYAEYDVSESSWSVQNEELITQVITELKNLVDGSGEKNKIYKSDSFIGEKIGILRSISGESPSFDVPFIRTIPSRLYKEIVGKNIKDNGKELLKTLKSWVTDKDLPTDDYIKLKIISSSLWKMTLEDTFKGIDDYKQLVYTGAPGTGKTYGIKNYVEKQCQINEIASMLNTSNETIKQYAFVQFHSSYDYSDFVEGLRPVSIKDDGDPTFVRMDGVFKRFCRDIVEYNNANNIKFDEDHNLIGNDDKPVPHFYFIIDEINRADLGKVFGELMYGLEENYRGEHNSFHTQYDNLPTYIKRKIDPKKVSDSGKNTTQNNATESYEFHKLTETEDVFSEGFYIPENLHIVGSMNDIDRSVETFDFALRRRFQWINIEANDVMEAVLDSMLRPVMTNGEILGDLIKNIKEMNKNISSTAENGGAKFGLDESYHIGPAYFKQMREESDINIIWNEKVCPILVEYVRGWRIEEDKKNFIAECKDLLLGSQDTAEDQDNEEAGT